MEDLKNIVEKKMNSLILDENLLPPLSQAECDLYWKMVQRDETNKDYSPSICEIVHGSLHPVGFKYSNCTFENYLVPPNNIDAKEYKKVVAACKRFICEDKKVIVLAGPVGTGKTHLAMAIMKGQSKIDHGVSPVSHSIYGDYILRCYRHCQCIFLPFNRFLDELEDNRREGQKDSLMQKYFEADIVCLNDLNVEELSSSNKKNLFTLIDGLYSANKKIIITTNNSLGQIKEMDIRIADRLLENGMFVSFANLSSYRLKNIVDKYNSDNI